MDFFGYTVASFLTNLSLIFGICLRILVFLALIKYLKQK